VFSDMLRVISLGGLGEIGRNMFVLKYDERVLIIGVGLMFPRIGMLGIDLVIPGFSYVLDRADHILGIILTHGQGDHVGGLVGGEIALRGFV
jgi:ribonuclease J